MSKAFTSEENEDNGPLELPPLPTGFKNYMTPDAFARLQGEAEQLEREFQTLSKQDVGQENRRNEIQRRLRYLLPRLEASVVIDPVQQPTDRVLFGCRVTVQDSAGERQEWTIVGLDEAAPEKGRISWMSPLANALLDKRVGDQAVVGKQRLTIVRIAYA